MKKKKREIKMTTRYEKIDEEKYKIINEQVVKINTALEEKDKLK